MNIRQVFLIGLGLAFVTGRILGLHSHISHWDDDELAEITLAADHHVEHGEHITVPEAEGAAGHLDAHLDHGDIDLDEPANFAGKTSTLSAPIALVGLAFALLLIIPCRASSAFQPPHRPPKYRSRPHLLPPSQAPPIAA